MKIFNNSNGWSEKVNFVDDNNVLLGYDMGQCCCEHADWFIANKPTHKILEQKTKPRLNGWNFDTKFFEKVEYIGDDGYNELDAGEMVIFRIVKGEKEKFIHLFNVHNGYYGHGFEFKEGNEIIKDYTL